MSTVGESYAATMLATRGAQQQSDDNGYGGDAPFGQQIEVMKAAGAIKIANPRNDGKILQTLKVMAAAAGSKWYYRWEVKNRKTNTTDIVEGPSIDCAMAVARLYGNCEVDVRVVDEHESWVMYARFKDFESGFSLTRAFRQRKSQSTGKMEAERQLDIAFQIGQSKAHRNVVNKALNDFTDFAMECAKESFVDRIAKRVPEYKAKAIARFAEMKVDLKRVELAVGKTAEQWMAPELAKIVASLQAVSDNMIGIDDLYPPLADAAPVAKEEPTRESVQAEAAKPAAEAKPAAAEEKKPEPEAPKFDIDGYVANAEENARALTSLDELTELDQDVIVKIEEHGDDDMARYWRKVVSIASKRIGEAAPPAAEATGDDTGIPQAVADYLAQEIAIVAKATAHDEVTSMDETVKAFLKSQDAPDAAYGQWATAVTTAKSRITKATKKPPAGRG